MVFCPLFSGSTGNASFVATAQTRILVDAGVSATRLAWALQQAGCDPSTLDGILVTHEHIDHIKGVGMMARKYGIRIYANELTWIAMGLTGRLGNIPDRCRVVYESGRDFALGDLRVMPLPISHDAADPSGYVLDQGMYRVGIATDTGIMPKKVLEELCAAQIVLLESNHDEDLLRENPAYPAQLKKRILGKKGHLSNISAGDAACELVRSGVSRLVLGHLSQHNNTPELAFDTVMDALLAAEIRPGRDVELALAWPDRIGTVWAV
jgi:phosphoribosyl 1,2-cyclic phosphodiesterase